MIKKTIVNFVQLSNELTAPNNMQREYYRKVYANNPGYPMPDHYMEIPTWIAIISGILPDKYYEKRLHVVTNLNKSINHFHSMALDEYLMFSVMDINKEVIKHLIGRTVQPVILGGYVEPKEFKEMPNVYWLDSPKEIIKHFEFADIFFGPDYSLFQDEWVIPRLSLSDGCLFDCAFCSIPRTITEYSWEEIMQQIESFKCLDFELVYVNDKTFGQATNWRLLEKAGLEIARYNPHFGGFIVQTTVTYATKYLREWYDKYFIQYIEVGVEAPDDLFLKEMKKPYRMSHLDKLVQVLREEKELVGEEAIKFIPNILIGLPDYDHQITADWVREHRDIIAFVNPFILCRYEDAHDPGWLENTKEINTNENIIDKTWLSEYERKQALKAMLEIFEITGGKYDYTQRILDLSRIHK